MISELVIIEQYFGRIEAVMTVEDLIRTYGSESVQRAIAEDEIELRFAFCRLYARLTDRARHRLRDTPVPVV